MDNVVITLVLSIFDSILFILAGNKDNHKSLDEYEFQAEQTSDYGVNCPWASGKICMELQWKICCDHSSAFIFERIFLILAGNMDNHKSLNEFDFWPHPTTNYRLSCPWASKI